MNSIKQHTILTILCLPTVWMINGLFVPSDGLAQTTQKESVTSIGDRAVLPIFQMRCVVCHGKRKQEGGLDLRTQQSRMAGGRSGPVIVAGDPDASLLLKRIQSGEMPPPDQQFANSVRPPSTAEIDTIRQWILSGARPSERVERKPIAQQGMTEKRFWAYQSPRSWEIPEVSSASRVRNPVDSFLLAHLELNGQTFSPEAEPMVLLRRVYLSLTGLLPTIEEIEIFLEDKRSNAYEHLVDRLLESSHYGERRARFWLNVAGYSDSEGKVDSDRIRPFAWRYRDYVIRSFNQDKPYDEFLMEQIAGDELINYRLIDNPDNTIIEKLVATGFLRMVADGTYSPPQSFIPERMNVIADEIEVLSSSVMGLTLGCARCHDHKYDPLSQNDYYRLSAVLQTAYDPYDWVLPTERYLEVISPSERELIERHNVDVQEAINDLNEKLERMSKPLEESLFRTRLQSLPEEIREDVRKAVQDKSDKEDPVLEYLRTKFKTFLTITRAMVEDGNREFQMQAQAIDKAISEKKKDLKELPKIRALYDMGGEPSSVYVLNRGDALIPGDEVQPGVPVVLSKDLDPFLVVPPWPEADTSGRRLALAKWLVQPKHPLTSRVMVNRIWQEHFGSGIVSTPANFGVTGALPSHPKLLDWLATEFVSREWSMKAMHRLIVTSTAYRQSSIHPDMEDVRDPDNSWMSRMTLRRMDAEQRYDSMLIATGQLDPKAFGSPVPVTIEKDGEVVSEFGPSGGRRSLYVLARRRSPLTMLELFDVPPMMPNCIQRPKSIVPTQALELMNSEQISNHAKQLALKLVAVHGLDNPPAIVRDVYLRMYTRFPGESEVRRAVQLLNDLQQLWLRKLNGQNDMERTFQAQTNALADLCHIILSSAEFSYIN